MDMRKLTKLVRKEAFWGEGVATLQQSHDEQSDDQKGHRNPALSGLAVTAFSGHFGHFGKLGRVHF